MADIIHQMEHPMVSEIRAQMETMQARYENELADKQEKIDNLEADISDLDGTFSEQYRQIDGKIREVKEQKAEAKRKGEPIPKFTIDDFAQTVNFNNRVFGSCAINILKEVSDLLDLVDLPEEKIIERVVTRSEPYIPDDVKKAVNNLKGVLDNYI